MHTDRGSQYGAESYRQLLTQHGMQQSMSREVFYNRQRCYSANGYLAPLVYEQALKAPGIFCPEKC